MASSVTKLPKLVFLLNCLYLPYRLIKVAVEKIYFAEYRPVSAYNTEDAPIEISIPGQGNEYIDLRRSRLYAKCKIVKSDGTALASQGKNWHYKPPPTITMVPDRYIYEWEISVFEY